MGLRMSMTTFFFLFFHYPSLSMREHAGESLMMAVRLWNCFCHYYYYYYLYNSLFGRGVLFSNSVVSMDELHITISTQSVSKWAHPWMANSDKRHSRHFPLLFILLEAITCTTCIHTNTHINTHAQLLLDISDLSANSIWQILIRPFSTCVFFSSYHFAESINVSHKLSVWFNILFLFQPQSHSILWKFPVRLYTAWYLLRNVER